MTPKKSVGQVESCPQAETQWQTVATAVTCWLSLMNSRHFLSVLLQKRFAFTAQPGDSWKLLRAPVHPSLQVSYSWLRALISNSSHQRKRPVVLGKITIEMPGLQGGLTTFTCTDTYLDSKTKAKKGTPIWLIESTALEKRIFISIKSTWLVCIFSVVRFGFSVNKFFSGWFHCFQT